MAGGRHTTYGVMATDAVDESTRALDGRVAASVTENVPLVGAEGFAALWNQRQVLAAQSGLHVARIEHLLRRQSTLIHELLAQVAKEPELGEQVEGSEDYLRVEFVDAASHDGGPAPARRAGPPQPAVDRDPRPGPGRCGVGGPADGGGAALLSATACGTG